MPENSPTIFESLPPIRHVIDQNEYGRDFIIGDLHGCYEQLLEKLQAANFDTQADRLFSVGDLVDRGPDSFNCLRLLNEPWFFSVLGNHEAMMLQAFEIRTSHCSVLGDFVRNGGHWYGLLSDANKELVRHIALKKVIDLPLTMTVRHVAGNFDIVHAQYYYIGTDKLLKKNFKYSAEVEKSLIWGRSLYADVVRGASMAERDHMNELFHTGKKDVVLVEPAYTRGGRITYVGHSIVRAPLLSRSHLFLDTGAYLREKGSSSHSLTMIEHGTGQLF